MNNFSMKLKKAFSNKNFVTALAFILIGVILVIFYNFRINAATSPVKVVYAKQTISPQTKITSEMVGTMTIAADAVNKEVIFTQSADVIGKYAKLESTIYSGSFFYKNAITTKDNLPTSALLDIPDGETLLYLKVNMATSYYNSLVPGDYFDLYVRTVGVLPEDSNNKKTDNEIIVGKLINKIKILAVKTADGKNVFGSDETREPASVLFSVPEEQALLMKKAEYFSKLSGVAEIEFIIVPRGQKYESEDGEKVVATITSEQLQNYIEDKTKDIDINEIEKNSKLNEE